STMDGRHHRGGVLTEDEARRVASNIAKLPLGRRRWSPTSVTDPRSRQAFTEEGAWEYIVEQLEANVTIYPMTLNNPPGKTGYYFLLKSAFTQNIYVKLQICGNSVMGRSFHYEHDKRDDDI